MLALTGLLLALFVAMISSTVVTNALPKIISDLHGSSTSYTWVVTATLLAMTATTPIWGKLADLFNRKLLVQTALTIFVLGSVLAGISTSTTMLISFRVVQGIGVGGLSALVQIAMAGMIAPRERGRYSGYLGATFAVATISGPLIGGVIVDVPGLGWRACFYLGLPIAVVAFVVLQRTLQLPSVRRDVSIDYLGATLIAAGVSCLLIWTSLAGSSFGWVSGQSALLLGGGLALLAVAVAVEARAKEPIVPLRLFRDRTIVLTIIASACVGTVMYSANLLFSQYYQLGRGKSPTLSGLLTIPMVGGLAIASLIAGRIITETGRWKRFLVLGTILIGAGLGLLGTVSDHTPLVTVSLFACLMGAGLGMVQQNLVLAAQNSASAADLGSTSSAVAFFRSLGGSAGVAALGAVLSTHVSNATISGLRANGLPADTLGDGRSVPDPSRLPDAVASVVHHAYGLGVADVFLICVPLAVLALLTVLFIPEVQLRSGAGVETVERVMTKLPARDRHDDGLDPDVELAAWRPTAGASPEPAP
ncbi:drug resistance transporter, EmrB/QacA subfamily [Parafrankia irregularis]|uniref:Drug resistance transporter, EmrB/QacA subfamily n=1 Tax=Parafrankia irregularis TaxID=795642 RepID=A0A0S4QRG1_9ACTN|nr:MULTISPECIES: MDR family MFS transporter [Parafrankia]MBE3202722.1 MFS transporter [Parafrankia sp. CH37]CUU57908.1 drug resistance transporter, EmrB/QacA subfamily [Parafrankia irregularis]